MADLEDLAGPVSRNGVGDRAASTSGRAAADIGADAAAGPKEMLTPPLRAALGKQGYKLVGALLNNPRHLRCSLVIAYGSICNHFRTAKHSKTACLIN